MHFAVTALLAVPSSLLLLLLLLLLVVLALRVQRSLRRMASQS